MVDRHNQVKLVDFGLAQKYKDSDGYQLFQKSCDFFRGNLMFSTLN